ncbi:MAG: 30S ribosomal protein S6 [Candidatus Magasanikbacteria bacterium]|nr:30S ribosomal protein S6 [Candidatus Magasanikbacteria bacterium]
MRKYELTAVFAGTISDTDLEAAVSRVQKLIEDAGATGVVRDALGKHKLSYEIKANKFGHIATFTFECDAAIASKITHKLKLSKEVLRFVVELFVAARLKRQPQLADSPLIKASREKEREERDAAREERGGRGGDRDDRNATATIFATGHVEKEAPAKSVEEKPVDLAEIDKKLDELLQGDLTPAV